MFHDRSYRILGLAAIKDAVACQRLAEVQSRLNILFPASVLEWYSREDATTILRDHSNDDPPISPPQFKLITWHSHTLLPIRIENQGVCHWAINLDGSEDPPVLVDVDSGGKVWTPIADSFSNYVYSGIWDYRVVFNQSALVQAQNIPFTPEAREFLERHFEQEVRTYGWPGSVQYRFRKDSQAILIWANAEQADWFVAAPNAKALQEILLSIRELDGVGHAFTECSDEGRIALAEFQK